MSIDVKCEGLSDLSRELLDLANRKFPKDTKNFLQRTGNKLKSKARANYKKGTTSGTKNRIMGRTRNEFPPEYYAMAEEFIDKMLNEKGLG